MMKTFRTLVLAAVAAMAAGAVVADTAQATEGPFLKVGGARLPEKGSEPIESKGGTYILTAGTIKITCTSQVTEAGGEIIGSTGANAGTSKETIKFSGCTVVGNGSEAKETAGECKVVGGTVTTEPVKNTLDFANEKSVKGETVLTLFQPVTGSVFVTIKFEGKCKLTSTAVEGSAAAEACEAKGQAVKVEEEAAEAEKGSVEFPATAIKADWVESGGVRKEVKVGLAAFGKASTLTGKTEIKLTSKKVWGVFTK